MRVSATRTRWPALLPLEYYIYPVDVVTFTPLLVL